MFIYQNDEGYMLTWWNAEGVHFHLSKCGRGTWQEKRLGTPALNTEVIRVEIVELVAFVSSIAGLL